jgi:hypothetical protein
MSTQNSGSEKLWDAIDQEKRRDRFLKRVSIAAWSVVFVVVLVFAVITGITVAQFVKAATVGAVPWLTVLGSAYPLVVVLGTVSLLIATLTTVGIFLRLRTASLLEIQLRLAALEEMLASRKDA